MLGKIAVGLAAATLLGTALIPTDVVAFERGGGGGRGGGVGHGGGFGGGGFGRGGGFARGFPPGLTGRGFVGRRFAGGGFDRGFHGRHFGRRFFGGPVFGLGLGLGYGAYGYYDDACYAWTPYGYRWICGYDY
jgi:hypothetical protein